eukprot:2896301-Amphidinium_carterae.1
MARGDSWEPSRQSYAWRGFLCKTLCFSAFGLELSKRLQVIAIGRALSASAFCEAGMTACGPVCLVVSK